MWPIWAELMPNLWLWIKVMLTVIKQFQSTVVSRCFRLLLDVSVTTSDAVCCYLNVYITTSGVVCCCSTSSSQRQMPFAIAWTSTSQRQVSLAAARTSTSQRQSPFVAAQRLRRDDVRCRFRSGQITIVCVMVLMDVKRLYNRYQLTFFGQPFGLAATCTYMHDAEALVFSNASTSPWAERSVSHSQTIAICPIKHI